MAAEGGPRSTQNRFASFEASLREAPQDEEGESFRLGLEVLAGTSPARTTEKKKRLPLPQWLSLGTPIVWATFWYFTAGFSTMPWSSWSTMARWISCQGVCEAG